MAGRWRDIPGRLGDRYALEQDYLNSFGHFSNLMCDFSLPYRGELIEEDPVSSRGSGG